MSGWGSEAWGAGPWGSGGSGGGGGGTFSLVGALAVRENVVRLFFTQPVSLSGVLDPFDGTVSTLYDVEPVAGTFGLDEQPARAVLVATVMAGPDPTMVDVVVDRPFTHYPSMYSVCALGLYTTSLVAQSTAFMASFFGVQMGQLAQMPDLVAPSRDFANPQTLSALLDASPTTTDPRVLGTLVADDTGDRATDEGIANLKKRIFRRLGTEKDRYAHLPGYGVLAFAQLKRAGRAGVVQALASDAEQQLRQEPGVRAVSVSIRPGTAGLFFYAVRVRTNTGKDFALQAPVMIGR